MELSVFVFHLQNHTLNSAFRWNLNICSFVTEYFLIVLTEDLWTHEEKINLFIVV